MKLNSKSKPTPRVFSEDVIHQSVCCKLSHIFRRIILIQGLQLSLALIELLVVTLKTNMAFALKGIEH